MTTYCFSPYLGERYSLSLWCARVMNLTGTDIGLQHRFWNGSEVVSSQKIYHNTTNKYGQYLWAFNPDDEFMLFYSDGSKRRVTKAQFYAIANDGSTILPHWYVIDADFGHLPVNFEDGAHPLYGILHKLDDLGIPYCLFGTAAGRCIKIVIVDEEILTTNAKKDEWRHHMHEWMEHQGECFAQSNQCPPLFPAQTGCEPLHAKTGQRIEILHATAQRML